MFFVTFILVINIIPQPQTVKHWILIFSEDFQKEKKD